jgi:predicted phosphoribosyltransferase
MRFQQENPLVLALPRGGVVVGYEVAHALGAPLDVIVSRNLGAPGHGEIAIGAIAPGNVSVVDEDALRQLHISQARFDRIVAKEIPEMNRRIRLYRGEQPPLNVCGRTVILVDDGVATGMTAYAALLALQQQHPEHLVVAAPVCAPQTAETMRAEVDDLVCASIPDHFRAVGVWYRDFTEVTDEEVVALLERNRLEQKQSDPLN